MEPKRTRISFAKHFLNEETKDATLEVSGVPFPVHKVVLSSASGLFERVFYSRFPDIDHSLVTEALKDVKPEVFSALLSLVYHQEVQEEVSRDLQMALQCFHLSKRLEMKTIVILLVLELKKWISLDNLCVFAKIEEFESDLRDLVRKEPKEVMKRVLRSGSSDLFFFLSKCLHQKEIIALLVESEDKEDSEEAKEWTKLIDLKECSLKELLRLKNLNLFHNKTIDKRIEEMFSQSEERCRHVSQHVVQEREERMRLQKELSDVSAAYREAKQVFLPFLEGALDSIRINQFVYQKRNCFFGKNVKKFEFKF